MVPITVHDDSWNICIITGDAINPNTTHTYIVMQKTKLLEALK